MLESKRPHSELETHREEVEKLWEQSENNPVIERLQAGEPIQTILESLPEFETAFAQMPQRIVCSDERIPAPEGGKIGIAGQLILAPDKEWEEFIKKYRGRIKEVMSHEGCGAAKVKFEQLKQVHELSPALKTPDQLGAFHTRQLADELGASYRHITSEEMTGPIHNARMIMIDGTSRFNPAALPELPAHFVSSGAGFGLSPNYLKTELKILTSIAFGDHGFGQRFDRDHPFYLVVSTKDQNQLKDLMELARTAVEEFGDRVIVQGLVKKIETRS